MKSIKSWNWGAISVVGGLAAASYEFPWLLIPMALCVAWGCGLFTRKGDM